MGGVRYPAEQWAEWIDEQEVSGLTVVEFCDAIGVSTASFYRWRGNRSTSTEKQSASRSETDRSNETRFVPLSIISRPRVCVEIELPCGAVVRVPADESALRCVLSTLMDVSPDESERAGDGATSCLR